LLGYQINDRNCPRHEGQSKEWGKKIQSQCMAPWMRMMIKGFQRAFQANKVNKLRDKRFMKKWMVKEKANRAQGEQQSLWKVKKVTKKWIIKRSLKEAQNDQHFIYSVEGTHGSGIEVKGYGLKSWKMG
jgi:hypothetical protein